MLQEKFLEYLILQPHDPTDMKVDQAIVFDVIKLCAQKYKPFKSIETLTGIWSRTAIRHITRTLLNMVGPDRGPATQDAVDRRINEDNPSQEGQIEDKIPISKQPEPPKMSPVADTLPEAKSSGSTPSNEAKKKSTSKELVSNRGPTNDVGSKRYIVDEDSVEQ